MDSWSRPLIGGRSTSAKGTLNILIDAGDPRKKQMKYRIMVTGGDGRHYTVIGFKDVSGDTLASAWPETTTLYTTLLDGHVPEGGSGHGQRQRRHRDPAGGLSSSGNCSRSACADPTPPPGRGAMARFGAMFLGKLWDVYGHQVGPF